MVILIPLMFPCYLRYIPPSMNVNNYLKFYYNEGKAILNLFGAVNFQLLNFYVKNLSKPLCQACYFFLPQIRCHSAL